MCYNLIVFLYPFSIFFLTFSLFLGESFSHLLGFLLVLHFEGDFLPGEVFGHLLDLKLEVGLQDAVLVLLFMAVGTATHSILWKL